MAGSDHTVIAPDAELHGAARSPGMLGRNIRKHHFYYWLMLPGLLYLLIFKYLPMLGISIAFLEINPFIGFKGVIGGEWIGFKNFPKFFGSYFFGNIVANTFIISGLKLLFSFPTTIVLALLINELVNVLYKRVVQTIRITLPSIAMVISILLIFNIGNLINAGFEQILLLYSPLVYDVSDIIDTYVYREGLQQLNFSYAAAVDVFKSVIALTMVVGANFIAKRLEQEGLW